MREKDVLRFWLFLSMTVLCGCGPAPPASLLRQRELSTVERSEARELIESLLATDYQRDFVGKTTADFSRLFELAETVHAIHDGRRSYRYRMHEATRSYEGMTDFWVVTDGGPSAPPVPASPAASETILEVGISVSGD